MGQQMASQGHQMAGQAIVVYQSILSDGTVLWQVMLHIPTSSPTGAQIVQASTHENPGGNGHDAVTVTLPGNVITADGTVRMVPGGGDAPSIQQTSVTGAATEQFEKEPVYVNAKQYHRILKRRQACAKLEAKGKRLKERRKYLYESRHLHAMNRKRGVGGRFISQKESEKVELDRQNTSMNTAPSAIA